MSEITFKIIELIVMCVMVGYLAAIRRISDNERASQIFLDIQSWADIAVRWAFDRLGDESGEVRHQAACAALKRINEKLGTDMTDDQISMLVSSAYQVITEDTVSAYEEFEE